MAQQTHFHSYKHCLLQLTHGFISSNNNQSFLSYYEELKQGNLLCRKYYYFFFISTFQTTQTHQLYDNNFEQNVPGSQI